MPEYKSATQRKQDSSNTDRYTKIILHQKNESMRAESLLLALSFMFCATLTKAQNDKHKMTDTQKAQAAKADVYIINSKKKMADSLTTKRDSTAAMTPKKKSCAKRNKKSS